MIHLSDLQIMAVPHLVSSQDRTLQTCDLNCSLQISDDSLIATGYDTSRDRICSMINVCSKVLLCVTGNDPPEEDPGYGSGSGKSW